MNTIDTVIAEITHTDVPAPATVAFAADVHPRYYGKNQPDDQIGSWILAKDGQLSPVVRLPKQITTAYREANSDGLVNFWLIEMAAPFAAVYGIEEFVLTDDEARSHMERLKAGWDGYGRTIIQTGGNTDVRTEQQQ